MKTKFLFSAVMIVILLAGCASPQATTEAPPTLAPSATPQPTVTPIPPSPTITSTATPRVTNIVIDGNSGDWGNYEALAYDPSGDAPQGSPDIEEVRAVINDQYVYLFIKLVDPAVTGKFDLGFETNSKPPDYFVTVWPREGRNVFAAGIGGGAEPNDAIATAQGDVVEVRFPRALVENKRISSFNIQIDLGGSVGDDMFEIRARALGEIEPTPLPGSQPKPEPSRVEFAAEDGHALVGYFYPSWKSNAPVVLLVHQYGLAQENWVKFGLVDWLQNWPPDGAAHGLFPAMPVDQSFAVFTLDLRGFGESGPAIPNNLSDEEFNQWGAGWVMDVKAAVEQIKSMPGVDANRIAIIGANNGADASVAACGDCLGVLALSAGSYAGLDTKTNAEKLDAAGKVVWCFSAEKSAGSDVATCSSLAGSQINWINFPGDGRGMQLIREDKAPEGIGANVLEFLVTTFGVAIAQGSIATQTSAAPYPVSALCTLMGRPVSSTAPGNQPIELRWGWSAKTREQVEDHIRETITVVTLDSQPVGQVVTGEITSSGNGFSVLFTSNVGVLKPGSHIITYDVSWKNQISDGTSTFGPGGQIESYHDQCELIVQ